MNRLPGCAIVLGIVIIIGGCFCAVALQNPGGPPPSEKVQQRAQAIARWSCGIGAALAIGCPVIVMAIRSRKNL